MPDDVDTNSLDRALSEAAAALLHEIRTEPVPQSITVLAEQLQAALDQRLKVHVVGLVNTAADLV